MPMATHKKVSVSYNGTDRAARSVYGLALGNGRTVYVPSVVIDTARDKAFAYAVVVKSQATNEVLWDGPEERKKLEAPAGPPTPKVRVVVPDTETPEAVAAEPSTEAPAEAPAEAPEAVAPVTPAEPPAPTPAQPAVADASAALIAAFENLNASKSKAFIAALTTVADVSVIDAWERANKRRASVFSAVTERLAELEPTE